MAEASTVPFGVPFGIAVPQIFLDTPIDMDLVRRFAIRAEELDYHSLWVQERIIGADPALEPVGLMNYLAALTSRVKLGSAMIIATTRNPIHMAKSFSSLDQISQGRLIIGISLGGRPAQYKLLDGPSEIRPGSRARHFRESLAVMKALWTQQEAHFDGQFWQLNGETVEPKPFQKPHPPIWFGGRHPQGLRRAAQLGEGWMGAGSTSTQQFREHLAIIHEELDARGRDPASFSVAKRVYVALDPESSRAETRLREFFGGHYNNADMAANVSVWGNAEECARGLAEVLQAGAQMLMLNPVFDYMEHLEALPEVVAMASEIARK